MSVISSTTTKFLNLPPSCIEICPWDHDIFAIGTYYLEKEDDIRDLATDEPRAQKRSGTVLLFRLSDDRNSFELVQTTPTDYAILDLHFPVHKMEGSQSRCLWTANSTGSLTCHTLPDSDSTIAQSSVIQQWHPSILVLAFTFHPVNPRVLGATLSDGSVVICHMCEGRNVGISTVVDMTKHDLEAWTMSFDVAGGRCLSGGDDAALQCSLVPGITEMVNCVSIKEEVEPVLAWKNRRLHNAGVTAILPLESNIILTGSYDDHIRVITLDRPPKLLAEGHLGGGVWRLKLIHTGVSIDDHKYDVLASCMHAGANIIRITLPTNSSTGEGARAPEIEVFARFEEHKSMNYGSDFIRNGYEYTILSTSFYDKKICLWRLHAEDFGPIYKTIDNDSSLLER